MKLDRLSRFLNFLQEDLQVSSDSIAMVMRREQPSIDVMPMLLWQYGSIDLRQLERIFDWLGL